MIWRNLYRDIEINRNPRSEELLKLGEGQEILISKGRVGEGEGLLHDGDVRKVLFSGGLALRKGGANFLGGWSYPFAHGLWSVID